MGAWALWNALLGLTKTRVGLRTERWRLLPDALRRQKRAGLRR